MNKLHTKALTAFFVLSTSTSSHCMTTETLPTETVETVIVAEDNTPTEQGTNKWAKIGAATIICAATYITAAYYELVPNITHLIPSLRTSNPTNAITVSDNSENKSENNSQEESQKVDVTADNNTSDSSANDNTDSNVEQPTLPAETTTQEEVAQPVENIFSNALNTVVTIAQKAKTEFYARKNSAPKATPEERAFFKSIL